LATEQTKVALRASISIGAERKKRQQGCFRCSFVLATAQRRFTIMTIITVLFSLVALIVLALWFFLANGTRVKGKPAVARRPPPTPLEQKNHRTPGID
jgi:hypothetical protein